MIFSKSKKETEKLKLSFGKIKGDSFNFRNIQRYFKNKDHSESFHVINDKTCHDLDFEDLFMFLDRTHSKVGQQILYDQLRTIPIGSSKKQWKYQRN